MRKALKITGVVIGVLFALVVIREGFFSLTAYFVIVPGAKLYSDGTPIPGWLHKGGKGQLFILTRNGASKRESYWIDIRDGTFHGVRDCGEWAAPKLPLVAIGDVNPPCFSFPQMTIRPLIFGARFVEFTARDGRRVRASW